MPRRPRYAWAILLLLGFLAPGRGFAQEEVASVVPPQDAYGLPTVEDDTWLSHRDNAAYYGLLHHAREIPEDQLRAAGKEFITQRMQASGRPTFVDMLKSPGSYRGQPVFLKGHILQTVEYEADENPYGITRLYESSLYSDDAQNNMTTVVFLEKPDNLPLGAEMVDGVQVAGYFLKLYWYDAHDNHTHKAPLILASTVTVKPPPVHQPIVAPGIAYPALLVGVALLVAIVWVVQRSDRKRLLQRREQELDSEFPDFSDIKPDGTSGII